MVAGLNKRATYWKMNEQDDDAVGGAVYSGTATYWNVPLSLQPNKEEQILLQQGLQTYKTFKILLITGDLSVREADELEVTFPRNDPYYGDRFRILRADYSNYAPGDPRGYILVTAIRNVRSHSEQ